MHVISMHIGISEVINCDAYAPDFWKARHMVIVVIVLKALVHSIYVGLTSDNAIQAEMYCCVLEQHYIPSSLGIYQDYPYGRDQL